MKSELGISHEELARLNRLPIRLLGSAILATGIIMGWLRWDRHNIYFDFRTLCEKVLTLEELRGRMIHLDEVLTSSVQMAAATGDLKWEKRFQDFEPQLERDILEATIFFSQTQASGAMKQIQLANQKLAALENQTFERVRQGRLPEAQEVLSSHEFEAQKQIYAEGMAQIAGGVRQFMGERFRSERKKTLWGMGGDFLVVVLLLTGWLFILQGTHKWQQIFLTQNYRLAQRAKELADLNATLDERVAQRTAETKAKAEELKKANQELLESQLKLHQSFLDLENSNEELQTMQSRLVQAEKSAMMNQLAAGVAHEVKNPLAILIQGVDFLTHRIRSKDPDVQVALKDMSEAVERADGTIRGLLDLTRPTQLVLEPDDLNSVIESALLLVKNYLDRHGVRVTKSLKPHLPSVRLDRGRMVQIFINLFTNSMEAMPPGGEIRVITDSKKLTHSGPHVGRRRGDAFRVGEEVVVAKVEDTGMGIPPEVLPKVFDPFFTTKRGQGGTGLGLPVVRNILEMHGGTVDIANRETGGASVTMMFPI